MDGDGGLAGWRWIFIIEGLFTVLVGIFAFWGMIGLPEDAKFLTEEERKQVLLRLEVDRECQNTHYSPEFVKQGFKDWKSYLYAVIYLGCVSFGHSFMIVLLAWLTFAIHRISSNCIPVYALSLFLPSIIANMGYKNADAQLLSTPPYILAMCSALLFAYISDKKGVRGPCVLFSEALAIIGYAILIATKNAKYSYVGTFLSCAGTYSTVPILVSWASNNTGGDTKKGVRIALMVGIGNLGGICSSFVYRCICFITTPSIVR